MADFGYFSQKISGAIDKFICKNFDKCPRTLPEGKFVSLCFDDFPKSAAQLAAPMIEQRGWRATWYVAGGFMGGHTDEYGRMFEASDLSALRQMGHDFGCHTFDHIDCRDATEQEIEIQARRSAAFLALHDIHNVRSFAFPFGAINLTAKRQMAHDGIGLRGVTPEQIVTM